ncbi:MAG: hypothetical protein AB1465_06030 [Patescibacteria group bacterium]
MSKKKKITLEDLAEMMQRQFDEIDGDMATKDDLKKMATKVDLKRMATKDDLNALEERLSRQINSLRGDLILVDRKEDKKLNFVINLLRKKNIFSQADLKAISRFRVFPRIEIHG